MGVDKRKKWQRRPLLLKADKLTLFPDDNSIDFGRDVQQKAQRRPLLINGAYQNLGGSLTLTALSLSDSSYIVGTAESGTIIGATTGSVITPSGLPTGLTINSAARTFAWDGSGSVSTPSITLSEALAGATNTPNVTIIPTVIRSVPDAPTIGSVTNGDTTLSVPFTAPAQTGGSAITSYKIERKIGAGSFSTIAATYIGGSPFVDAGLTNGTAYTYQISATNGVGTGAASSQATGTPSGVATNNELMLIAGQSLGMTAGVVGTPPGWPGDTARIKFWDITSQAFVTYSPASLANFGPESGYAMEWLTANAANSFTLYIVKYAVGGTQLGKQSIYGKLSTGASDWDPSTSGGYYGTWKANIIAGKAALTGASISYVVKDVLWIQAESDCHVGEASLTDYGMNCINFYATVRAELSGATSRIVTHTISEMYSTYDHAQALVQQRSVVAVSALNYMVSTRDLFYQTDLIHVQGSGSVLIGRRAYQVIYGTIPAPTFVSLSNRYCRYEAVAGFTIGTLDAFIVDMRADPVWTLNTASSNFEIVGNQLRVKTGASLTTGSTVLSIRATSYTGAITDTNFTIVVASPEVGNWWDPDAIIHLDYVNNRYFYNGTSYTSIAAMVTAGVYTVSADGDRLPVTSIIPSTYTIYARGVTSLGLPDAGTSFYLAAIDDGFDGAANDNMVGLSRALIGTPASAPIVAAASTTVMLTSVARVLQGGGQAIETCMGIRISLNDMAMASCGVAGTTDTSNAIPTVTTLVIGNRSETSTSLHPWVGPINWVKIVNRADNNAAMAAATAL